MYAGVRLGDWFRAGAENREMDSESGLCKRRRATEGVGGRCMVYGGVGRLAESMRGAFEAVQAVLCLLL
jgi:hypothetical protein